MFRMLYLYRIRPLNFKPVNSNRKLTAGAISLKSRNRKGSPRALCVKPVTGLLKLPKKDTPHLGPMGLCGHLLGED